MNAFSKICEDNYTRIYNYVFLMTKDGGLAEDITQEVFLKAYEKGDAFLRHPEPTGFLCRTAKYLTYDAARKHAREAASILEENEKTTEGDLFELALAEKTADFDEYELVPHVMKQLSQEEQFLYKRYYVDHIPMKKIAGELGIKESTIRVRYLRLRETVKRIVEELNLEESF